MTMPSDRDLAQQWLAERLVAITEEAWGVMPDHFGQNYLVRVAAAILDTPGVEVEARSIFPSRQMPPRGSAAFAWESTGPAERRLVIKLPIDDKGDRDVQR